MSLIRKQEAIVIVELSNQLWYTIIENNLLK